MSEDNKIPELLPNIEEFYKNKGTVLDCKLLASEYIEEELMKKADLKDFEARKILDVFFQELRYIMLNNVGIQFQNFGDFKLSGRKRKRPIFVPAKKIRKIINET